MSETKLELLTRVIGEGQTGRPDDFNKWKEQARTALRVFFDDDDDYLVRFDEVKYGLSIFSDRTPDSEWAKAKENGVGRAVAILEAALTHIEHMQPDAGSFEVGSLHPWVAGSAESLWANGHHRTAVVEAARQIEVQLRSKLGLNSKTAVSLVSEAFSTKPPMPGQPRLRFQEFEIDSDNWKNAHEGALAFGRGCMMRTRNMYTHGEEPSSAEALEALASLSLLARWINQAQVEHGK